MPRFLTPSLICSNVPPRRGRTDRPGPHDRRVNHCRRAQRGLGGRSQCGFTLIEVLIASIIFGVGLMGLAGLQTMALQANYATWQKNGAALLVHDFFERLHANPQAALAPDEDASYVSPTDGWSAATLSTLDPASAAGICQDNQTCSPEEMRRHDLWFWISRPHMLARLPNARAIVERAPAEDGFWYHVTLEWGSTGTTDTSSAEGLDRPGQTGDLAHSGFATHSGPSESLERIQFSRLIVPAPLSVRARV